MAEPSPIIFLEFNELTPHLMQRFMQQGHLPNFSRFYREADVFTTDSGESPGSGRLNPWVQWVTVHSGMSADEHGIFKLSDGHKLKKQRIWDVLSEAKRKVWVCGSMNAFFTDQPQGFVLPDPWSDKVRPFPDQTFAAYYHFVRTQVQEHTNKKVPLSFKDYLRFLIFMMGHGLSPRTATSVITQLIRERLRKGSGWRRATLMDRFQFDVFKHFYKKTNPHFATFFLNSTAHFQHVFWRDMEPEAFTLKGDDQPSAKKKDAVLFGYQQMDKLVGQFLKLAGNHTTLAFATGLSQQPCLNFEDTGGKRFYRPLDFNKLFQRLGLPGTYKVVPVMSEEFHLYFDKEADAEAALSLLASQHVNQKDVFAIKRQGQELFGGCKIHHNLEGDVRLRAHHSQQDLAFFDYFYKADAVKSGMHHPDGMFWLRRPNKHHQVHENKVSLEHIAPTFLDILGVPKPSHMKGSPLIHHA